MSRLNGIVTTNHSRKICRYGSDKPRCLGSLGDIGSVNSSSSTMDSSTRIVVLLRKSTLHIKCKLSERVWVDP